MPALRQTDCLENLTSASALADQLGIESRDDGKDIGERLEELEVDPAYRTAIVRAGWRLGYGIAAAMRICDVPNTL